MSVAPRRILLFGGTGQIGAELQRTLAPLGEVIAPGRAEADFERPGTLAPLVAACRPALVVNAAAYTAVEEAEADEERCLVVNGEAPGVLARACADAGALLVHYSTDYVFDGRKAEPYVECDAPAPLNAYGRSKLAGERAVAAAGGAHLIFRTSWVYASRGRNFVRTIVRAARERPELRVVHDQWGAPTWARDIAEATARVCASALDPHDPWAPGVYHMTAAGSTTWYGFASAILDEVGKPSAVLTAIVPVTSAEFPQKAERPRNSRLSGERLAAVFGVTLAHWRLSLRRMLAEPGVRGELTPEPLET